MSRYWSALVGTLDPYVPGEQPKVSNLVKLNTNEHPLGPSPLALEAMHRSVDESLRLYPDPASDQLRQAIARHHGVGVDQIFVGNGSDEVLAHVFQGLLKHENAPLRFPDISYSFYPVYCGLFDIPFEKIPLDASFRIRASDYVGEATGAKSGPIIFPNPNAPTGIALALNDVETIVRANPQAVVVVDEAYVDFGAESAVALVNTYPNLLTVHTLSKSRSLAGLRVGYAIGQADLIQALDRVKNCFNSYPVDRIAQAGAAAAIDDEAYFAQASQYVIDERNRLTTALEELGFDVLPSSANFVFARHASIPGAQIAEFLRERHVLVRHFQKPRIENFLRISIGTSEQSAVLLAALKDLTV